MPAHRSSAATQDLCWMNSALCLAQRGFGSTSPNPMVGAVLVNKAGRLIGRGWHRRAGEPHAEIEAIRDALAQGNRPAGATLYVTLEPCSTHGRTPPCTDALIAHRIARVVVAATDPNPKHAGQGLELLRQAGVDVVQGLQAEAAGRLNEPFNHWIVHQSPWVIVKAAMSLDGKIATAAGQSRWITGPAARSYGMKLRQGADAILVGVNTVLADDPRLTVRRGDAEAGKPLRRLILDARARTPLTSHVLSDAHAELTTIIASERASRKAIAQVSGRAKVLLAPEKDGRIDLKWLLATLGRESVTSLLVEGGGEVNASFLLGGLAHRIVFFYAPKIIGGRTAPTAVDGVGTGALTDALRLSEVRWRRVGLDLLLTARVAARQADGKDA